MNIFGLLFTSATVKINKINKNLYFKEIVVANYKAFICLGSGGL